MGSPQTELRLKKPVYKAPKQPPDWAGLPIDQAIEKLKHHLQTAVLIELTTIPMYLYAGYSIKDNFRATYKIINVVKQEMLHLGLAGNILCAIGGQPHVYGHDYTPQYPREIFYEKVPLNLKPATIDTLMTFEKVEAPAPQVFAMMVDTQQMLEDFDSIGEFYQDLKRGVKIVSDRMSEKGRRLFLPSTFPRQFSTPDGSWADDDMKVITNLQAAEDAMEVIIEQGEGATSEGDNIPSGIQSHYEVFKELHELSKEGKLLCYDVVENINPANYKEEKFHGLMIACDAAYSYLLLTIEIMWAYDGHLRGRLVTNNIQNLMMSVLRPIALFLVAQKITSGPDKDKHAGPPFRRYDFQHEISALGELQEVVKNAVGKYPNEKTLTEAVKAVDALLDVNKLN